MQRDKRAIDFD